MEAEQLINPVFGPPDSLHDLRQFANGLPLGSFMDSQQQTCNESALLPHRLRYATPKIRQGLIDYGIEQLAACEAYGEAMRACASVGNPASEAASPYAEAGSLFESGRLFDSWLSAMHDVAPAEVTAIVRDTTNGVVQAFDKEEYEAVIASLRESGDFEASMNVATERRNMARRITARLIAHDADVDIIENFLDSTFFQTFSRPVEALRLQMSILRQVTENPKATAACSAKIRRIFEDSWGKDGFSYSECHDVIEAAIRISPALTRSIIETMPNYDNTYAVCTAIVGRGPSMLGRSPAHDELFADAVGVLSDSILGYMFVLRAYERMDGLTVEHYQHLIDLFDAALSAGDNRENKSDLPTAVNFLALHLSDEQYGDFIENHLKGGPKYLEALIYRLAKSGDMERARDFAFNAPYASGSPDSAAPGLISRLLAVYKGAGDRESLDRARREISALPPPVRDFSVGAYEHGRELDIYETALRHGHEDVAQQARERLQILEREDDGRPGSDNRLASHRLALYMEMRAEGVPMLNGADPLDLAIAQAQDLVAVYDGYHFPATVFTLLREMMQPRVGRSRDAAAFIMRNVTADPGRRLYGGWAEVFSLVLVPDL